MTTPNCQQSLEAARRASHFLKLYIQTEIVDDRLRAEIGCLLDEFERLDEQARGVAEEREDCAEIIEIEARRYGGAESISRKIEELLLTLAIKIRARSDHSPTPANHIAPTDG